MRCFSVIDIREPRQQTPVKYVPAPQNTWNIHLQTHEDLLLVVNAKDVFAAAELHDEKECDKGVLGTKVGTADAKLARDWTAGLAVYDIANPAERQQIGFMPIKGGGIHRFCQ